MTKCIKNRHGKTYSLTSKGQSIVDNNMPNIAAEIHALTQTMLGS